MIRTLEKTMGLLIWWQTVLKSLGPLKYQLLIDKNNIIVAGHTRHKAAKKLGLKEVPVIVADDLTE